MILNQPVLVQITDVLAPPMAATWCSRCSALCFKPSPIPKPLM